MSPNAGPGVMNNKIITTAGLNVLAEANGYQINELHYSIMHLN